MKNYYYLKAKSGILILLLLIGFQAVAQDDDSNPMPKNEIRLDAFDAAFLSALDVSYERVEDLDIGYGVSVFANFRDHDGYNEKFAITPFFRFYFFNKQDFGARGLFAEVFSKFASGEHFENRGDQDVEVDYFDAALGLAIGKKWVNKRGFMLEISAGGGRNLGLDNNSPEFIFRGGISIGYRF